MPPAAACGTLLLKMFSQRLLVASVLGSGSTTVNPVNTMTVVYPKPKDQDSRTCAAVHNQCDATAGFLSEH